MLLGLTFLALFLVGGMTYLHGIFLGFSKKWYIGVAAISIPLFAQILSVSNLFGKDLLE